MIIQTENNASFIGSSSIQRVKNNPSKYEPVGGRRGYWQMSAAGTARNLRGEAAFRVFPLLRYDASFARLALFVVYFWFGLLKVLGVSPAGPLVTALWLKTIPFIPLDKFMIGFASYEMLIGIMFVIPRLENVAIASLLLHVFTTCMPLVLLPHIVWQMFMVPSLEGQYIIKNIVIVALALSIGTRPYAAPNLKRGF